MDEWVNNGYLTSMSTAKWWSGLSGQHYRVE